LSGGSEGVSCLASNGYQVHRRIKSREVLRVGGDDGLSPSAGADHDVGVNYVGGSAGCEKSTDIGRVDPIEFYDVCGRLADQPR
jgi:hypothetical protein